MSSALGIALKLPEDAQPALAAQAKRARQLLSAHMHARSIAGTWLLEPVDYAGTTGARVRARVNKDDDSSIFVVLRPDKKSSSWRYKLVPVGDQGIDGLQKQINTPHNAIESVASKPARPADGQPVRSPIVHGYPDALRSDDEASIMALADALGIMHPAYIGRGLYSVAVMVQPEQARRWLNEWNVQNRTLKQESIERISKDVREGRYELNHQPIAFTMDAEHCWLIDGQNRLYVIAAEDIALEVVITFGVKPSAVRGMDQHVPRKLNDLGRCLGDTLRGMDRLVGATLLGANMRSRGLATTSVSERYEFFEKHRTRFEMVEKLFAEYTAVPGVTTGGAMRAAIIRASYHENWQNLVAFVAAVHTTNCEGPAGPGVITLRDRLLQTEYNNNRWSTLAKRYCLITRAIYNFCQGTSPSRLIRDTTQRYTMPNEAALVAAE